MNEVLINAIYVENLFYNVVSFIVGILVFLYTIFNFKGIQLLFKSLLIVFSFMFLALGVIGFFVSPDYSYFVIIGFLFLCIASVVVLIVSNKWKQEEKQNKDKII